MSQKSSEEKFCFFLMWAAIFVYVGAFFLSCVLRFNSFDYYDFDLAVYDQVLWAIASHGETFNPILGISFLGQHAHFLAFPLALIYKIFPHPLTVLFLQTFVLAMGAMPLYLLASRLLNCRWALVVGCIYLLYPPMGYVNTYEFHFTPFATLASLWALYFFWDQRYKAFLLTALFSLFCQENMALVMIAWGIYALCLRRGWQWWLPLITVGLLYFLFCVKWLFPTLNPDHIQFISIYQRWGKGYDEILLNLIRRPGDVGVYLASLDHIRWIFQLFVPFLFIPWLASGYIFPAIPLFLQHLLSSRSSETTIYFHYAAEMIPFIFVAFVFGLQKIVSRIPERSAEFLKIFLIIWAILIAAWMGPQLSLFDDKKTVQTEEDVIKARFISFIPEDAHVVATFEFLTHINHRKHLYSFHHIFYGYYTLSQKPYESPDGVNYAILDLNDPLTMGSFYTTSNYHNFQMMLSKNNLLPVMAQDGIVLFKSQAKDPVKLFTISEASISPEQVLFSDGSTELILANIVRSGEKLQCGFIWKALKRTNRDLNISLRFFDHQNRLIKTVLIPAGYRIHPTQSLDPGTQLEDQHLLTVPFSLKEESLKVRMSLYDQTTGEIVQKDMPLTIMGN